jgi:hypothetical protein
MQKGFIYAATGELYVTLARRSARALRVVHPDAQIDLFTDAALEDPVFNQVQLLENVSRRPKMEALLRSRFDHTIYLDADTAVVAPIDDVFEILDHFDIALCSEYRRNDGRNLIQIAGFEVPPSFPPLNGGFIALRKSEATAKFIGDWHDWVHNRFQQFDQPSLRALLLRSSLRMHILPPEYNVMFFVQFMKTKTGMSAPRLIHQPQLHNSPPGDPMLPLEAKDLLGQEHVAQLAALLAQDRTIDAHVDVLEGGPGKPLVPGKNLSPKTPIGGARPRGFWGTLSLAARLVMPDWLYRRLRRLMRRLVRVQSPDDADAGPAAKEP